MFSNENTKRQGGITQSKLHLLKYCKYGKLDEPPSEAQAIPAIVTKESIKQPKRKTSSVQSLRHLNQEHQAPDHEATQPMMGY
jgi:hypothetical protein